MSAKHAKTAPVVEEPRPCGFLRGRQARPVPGDVEAFRP